MNEKRYLVYKRWNGQIHTSIEYGTLTNGEGKIKRNLEIKRIELQSHDSSDLNILKIKYPLPEEAKEIQ